MERLKKIPNILISLSPACFLLCTMREEGKKDFGISNQYFFKHILRRYQLVSDFFRSPLHFLPLQKGHDYLSDLTLAAFFFPSLSLLFKKYFSFAPFFHLRGKVKEGVKTALDKNILLKRFSVSERRWLSSFSFLRIPSFYNGEKSIISRKNFHLPESLYTSRPASALAFLYNSGLHTDLRVLSQSSIKEIGNTTKDTLLKTTWMPRTYRELKSEGISQIKSLEGFNQENFNHEVFSHDKYLSDIGRGVEKSLQGKLRALKIPYISRMPFQSGNSAGNLSMFFFSQNVRRNSEADACLGESSGTQKNESLEEKPFRNKEDSFSKYLTYDGRNTWEMMMQRYVSLIPFIKGRSSISRNVYDITSISHFSPNIHTNSQDAFVSGRGAQKGIHTIQKEASARSESVSRSQHLTYSGKYNWEKLREEHRASQGSIIDRKPFQAKLGTDFPPIVYASPVKPENSGSVMKKAIGNLGQESSPANSSLPLNPWSFSSSFPESDLVNLSDRIYSLIVERVRREREKRGY